MFRCDDLRKWLEWRTMRCAMALTVLAMTGCHAKELSDLRSQNAALTAKIADAENDVSLLEARLKLVERQRNNLSDAAAKCSETAMATALREYAERNTYSLNYNLGIKPQDIFNVTGLLKDPAGFAKRLRDWYVKRKGSEALTGIVSDFGSVLGSAIYYGRVGG